MSNSILLLCIFLSLIAVSSGQKQKAATPGVGCGPINAQLFKCLKFGFKYQVPAGWVDRTAEMQAVAEAPPATENDDGRTEPGSRAKQAPGSRTLLAVFERPPQAAGETINSAVIIAVENRSEYPQVKTASDYFAVIGDLAAAGGLKQASDPYPFSISGKQLLRADFAGQRGHLAIYQATLVMLTRGEIVSFTFVGQDDDEVQQLIGNLQFGPTRLPTQH